GSRLRWHEYPVILGALWLLLNLKYYWAAVFFPSVVTTLLVHWLVAKRVSKASHLAAWWLSIFAVMCLVASFTHPNFYLENFIEVIRQNHSEFVAISSPGNLIHFPFAVNGWL